MNTALESRLMAKNSLTISKDITILPKTGQRGVIEYTSIPVNDSPMMRSGNFVAKLAIKSDGINEGVRVVTGEPPIVKVDNEEEITRVSPLELEAIYIREGMVYTWINRLVGYHLASRPEIVCDNIHEQVTMNKIISPARLREILKSLFAHEYTYGNHFLQWEMQGEKPIGLFIMDPKYVDAVRDGSGNIRYDSNGNILGYVYYLKWTQDTSHLPQNRIISQPAKWNYQSGKGVLYNSNEIIHSKLNSIGTSWSGVGIIEPSYNLIRVKQNTDEGFGEMMQRTGFPRIVVYVGDQAHPPTQEQIDDLWDKMSDLHTKHQFIIPYYNKMEILESGRPERFSNNLQYFVHGVVAGLGGPKPFITGSGEDTNRATLGDQKLWLERDLKNQQEEVSTEFEEKILKVIAIAYNFKSVPKIKWTEISTESLEGKIERLVKEVQSGLLMPSNELTKYIIEVEGLPIKVMENPQPIQKKGKPIGAGTEDGNPA